MATQNVPGSAPAPRRVLNPYLALLLTMIGWGSAFPTSEIAVDSVPHEVAALLRFGGGAVMLLILLMVSRGAARRMSVGNLLRSIGTGLVGVFAYNALFFWGLSFSPALDASLIVPVLSPVLTTTVLVLVRSERAAPARILGLGIGVVGAGVFFLGVAGGLHGDSRRLWGDLIFLCGAVFWAGYTLLSKKVLAGVDPLPATTYGMLAGAVALALYASPELVTVHWSGLSTGFWVDAIYLMTAPTALAYVLYYLGIRAVGASTATVMMFVVPVIGSVGSFLLLGERINLIQGLGAGAMLIGALLAVTQGFRRRRPAVPDTPELVAEIEPVGGGVPRP